MGLLSTLLPDVGAPLARHPPKALPHHEPSARRHTEPRTRGLEYGGGRGATLAQLVARQQQWCAAAAQLLEQLKSGQRLSAAQMQSWREQQQWLMAQKTAWEAMLAEEGISLGGEEEEVTQPAPASALPAATLVLEPSPQQQPALSVGLVGSAHNGRCPSLCAGQDDWLFSLGFL